MLATFLPQDLLKYDPLLTLEVCHRPQQTLHRICNVNSPCAGGVLFIKNDKFFKKCLEEKSLTSELLSQMALVIDPGLHSKLMAQELFKNVAIIYFSKKVELSLARLSQPFYQSLYGEYNDFVDGRQMGTAVVDPSALIAQGVFIGEKVTIGPHVVIHSGCSILSHSQIGEGTILYPNVSLYRHTNIGKYCRIHSGVVIGADGFGYTFSEGQHQKIWHMGGVQIGDQVEIGSNSCIDQGTFSPTQIGDGCKIDNLVQVGHNCKLGRGVILCGNVGVAGSATLEDFCVVGGGAGIGPDVVLGMGTQVGGHAGVNCSWPAGSQVAGHPARPVKEWLRSLASINKLVEAQKK